eukprot:TRINITY_DN3388_c0_g1_i1.p1 TRINITY_DN3388_c0_g1~~TRINITY_DN3388_c0_g1_i1.p1  ORF type:complete len:393 (+),score=83.23 TRINITY_DN3388_c0_g1_i1:233-1411(+)
MASKGKLPSSHSSPMLHGHGASTASSSSHNPNIPSTHSNLIFQPKYNLLKILFKKKLQVIKLFFKALQTDVYDEVAKAMIILFDSVGDVMRLLRWGIQLEVGETIDAATLFRGTSMTTKLVSYFMKREGGEYLKAILGATIRMFCIDEVSIEVDPNKAGPKENVEVNAEMLLGLSKGISDHIFRSKDLCTIPMRLLMAEAQESVKQKFAEHIHRVVGGFYFLRFLVPALVTPEHFGLIGTPPNPKSRRSLILVSKVQQNLANDVEFGEKEPYMLKFNSYIVQNQAAMVKFLDELANYPIAPDTKIQLTTPPTEEEKEESLKVIVKHIEGCKVKLEKLMVQEGMEDIFKDLLKAVDNFKSGKLLLEAGSVLPLRISPACLKTVVKSSSASQLL